MPLVKNQAIAAALNVARKARADGGRAKKEYPLAPRSEWYGDANYQQTGGVMTKMHPDEFLSRARPMSIDETARDNIDDLKSHIQSGRTLDPLALYSNGKEDGRHRAHAARELGMKSVPVLIWPKAKKANGGGLASFAMGGDATTVTEHVGPIKSHVAGRTDHLPMHVPSGSYVFPADVVSAHGEGNTAAGFKAIQRMFENLRINYGGNAYDGGKRPYSGRQDPYAGGPLYGQPDTPYGEKMPRARGGGAGAVPIVAAGGEYVASPEEVLLAGDGDMERGHRVLDAYVLRKRAETIKTLKGLPGPKRN
jgi:hypothetical protein